jgi:NAD-dependent dihydropyrimidine dehydrogenase PreA subunit
MTYVITAACLDTLDQSCVDVCPVDCIHFEEGADRMEYIDPDECIDCGACEPACPVSAIFAEDDVPEDQEIFKEINALWYQDKAAARAKIPS